MTLAMEAEKSCTFNDHCIKKCAETHIHTRTNKSVCDQQTNRYSKFLLISTYTFYSIIFRLAFCFFFDDFFFFIVWCNFILRCNNYMCIMWKRVFVLDENDWCCGLSRGHKKSLKLGTRKKTHTHTLGFALGIEILDVKWCDSWKSAV